MKQCLRYLKGTTSFGITFEKSGRRTARLVGYSDSSHNVDADDGRSTTGHISILERVPSHGVLRSRIHLHYLLAKLSLWQVPKQRDKPFGFRICFERSLEYQARRLSYGLISDQQVYSY